MCESVKFTVVNECGLRGVNIKEICGKVDQSDVYSARIRRYLIGNPGALFIIVFDALILSCAFLLIQDSPLVDSMAVLAYCFLVVGVVLQAIAFLKDRRSGV